MDNTTLNIDAGELQIFSLRLRFDDEESKQAVRMRVVSCSYGEGYFGRNAG